VKVARQEGAICNLAPEYDDCRRLAKEKELPLKEVYEIVKEAARRHLGGTLSNTAMPSDDLA